MSPLLFNCALDKIFRNLNWETKGIKINRALLNNLKFADDVVLVAGCWDNLQGMLEELICQSRSARMEINMSKTKILTNTQQHQKIKIKGHEIELVDSIIYLGQTISFQNQDTKEINRKIAIGWNKFWSLKSILKNNFPISYKSQIFNSCVLRAMTYGFQTWSLSSLMERKLRSTQNSKKRAMLGVKLRDKTKIKKLKATRPKNKNIGHFAKRLKWDCAGHLSRQKEFPWASKVIFWQM